MGGLGGSEEAISTCVTLFLATQTTARLCVWNRMVFA